VKIEKGDRRYVVLFVNGKYKGKKTDPYWSNLFKEADQADFYDQLFTFYMNRDISKFDPSDIPETQAKNDLVDAGKSPIDVLIEKHYKKFTEGINVSDALDMRPPEYKTKRSFALALAGKCDKKRVREGQQLPWKYFLKPEFAKFYQPDSEEAEDETQL
jgi:hypothetical protein